LSQTSSYGEHWETPAIFLTAKTECC
jgi:hypothetical protein